MNEEIKIIIKAITDDVNNKLDSVNKKLNKMHEGTEKVSVSLDKAKKAMSTVSIAIGVITGTLAAYGMKANEAYKAQSRLNGAFTAAGGSTKQASKVYSDLMGILGDSDAATEAAQSLARITTEEKALSEYTEILSGIYSNFGQGMSFETITESISESAALGKVTGELSRALVEAGVSEDAFNNSLASLNSQSERETLIRQTLNNAYGESGRQYQINNAASIEYNKSQAVLNQALAQAAAYMYPFMTALTNVATVLLQSLAPAIKYVIGVIVVLINWIAGAARAIGSLFGVNAQSSASAFGESISTVSTGIGNLSGGAGDLNKGLQDATKSAEKLKKQTMGFDELNIMQDNSSSGGSAGSGGTVSGASIPTVDIPNLGAGTMDFSLGFKPGELDEIEERLKAILALAASVGAAFLTWKILDAVTNPALSIASTLKTIGGYALIVAGAMLTIVSYTDAWVNGVSWGNLAGTLVGLTAVVGGVALAFGALAASVAIVGAGVALLVLGVVDFIKNGPTVQNTILVIGGAIAIAVGLATAGVSVLIAAIVAVVAAIGAFVAAILLEEPAIMSVEEAQNNLTTAKQAAAEAEMGYVNAVDAAEASLNKLKEAEEAAGITGEDLYKQVQSGTLDYADMTDA